MQNKQKETNQITGPNNINSIEVVAKDFPDLLSFWVEVYFRYEVTTSERSQKEQRRDLNIFLKYMEAEVGNTLRSSWCSTMWRSKRYSISFGQPVKIVPNRFLHFMSHSIERPAMDGRWRPIPACLSSPFTP